jgi:hypothetical protein
MTPLFLRIRARAPSVSLNANRHSAEELVVTSALQLSLVASLAAGMGIFLVFLRHIFARERRRMTLLDVHPPHIRLLRPPGTGFRKSSLY